MTCPIVAVVGTGTEIGKTHVSTALLLAWGAHARVAGLKPVETGVVEGHDGEDAARLRAASTFHVKPWPRAPFTFREPISPHLAARYERRDITLAPILAMIHEVAAAADGVLVELAGGLFSPLAPDLRNADVVRALRPSATLLVAPNRLGVLHDLAASTIASAACGVDLSCIALVDPAQDDSSTSSNAAEIPVVTDVPLGARIPRAPADDLARGPAIAALVARLGLLPRR